MNKYERIAVVKSFDLNAEDSVLCKDEAEVSAALSKWPKTSVRTMAKHDGNDTGYYGPTPHIPVLQRENALHECNKLLAQGWWLIISECIDPKDALMAGAVHVMPRSVIAEMALGQVTTRTVTHGCKIDAQAIIPTSVFRDPMQLAKALEGKPMIWAIMASLQAIPSEHFIAECSYYKIPVGCKKEHVIIWELQDDGTHKSIFR
jgi:hypothetical protein